MRLQQRSIGYKKNPNSVHAFNRFEEEDHVETYECHFRLNDLKRNKLHDMAVPVAEE